MEEKPREGDYIKTQYMSKAGLQEVAMLYLRDCAVDLLRDLDKIISVLYVEGSPGTGKSSVVWAWACLQGYRKKSIVWLHLTHGYLIHVVVFHEGAGKCCTAPRSYEDCGDLLPCYKDCVVIVDGITHDNEHFILPHVEFWSTQNCNRKVVCVESQSRKRYRQELPSGAMEFFLPAWTIEEYKLACNKDTFYEGIKEFLVGDDNTLDKDKTIENKFFFAGHSAGFFFGQSIDEVIQDIEKNITSLSSLSGTFKNLI